MPHVRKADLLNVVRELWGGTGVLEDEAKLVLVSLGHSSSAALIMQHSGVQELDHQSQAVHVCMQHAAALTLLDMKTIYMWTQLLFSEQ